MINVGLLGSRADGVTDDTAAILQAAATAVSFGTPTTIYFPAGVYRLRKPVPIFRNIPVSLRGDGYRSIILVDPLMGPGDVFSWSECWNVNALGSSSIINPATIQPGVTVQGLHVTGQNNAGVLQNGFRFYDRNDEVTMIDVTCSYLTGQAFSFGFPKFMPISYLRESRFFGLRATNCGSPGAPAVEFNTFNGLAVGGDATNEVSVDALDIFAPGGPGLVIRNNNTLVSVRDLKFSKLRVEGLQNGNIAGDLLQVGDNVALGNVSNIDFVQSELIDPYGGFSALRFMAANVASMPFQCRYQGMIGGGLANGGGIRIDAGRLLSFLLRGINTNQTNVTIGPTPLTGSGLFFDGNGAETGWTWNVDGSAASNVSAPARLTGVP